MIKSADCVPQMTTDNSKHWAATHVDTFVTFSMCKFCRLQITTPSSVEILQTFCCCLENTSIAIFPL